MSSEIIHGITEQPADSCPLVDAAAKSLDQVRHELRLWETMTESELRNACDYAEFYAASLDTELEEIRAANEAIRAWGQEWKELAKSTHKTEING